MVYPNILSENVVSSRPSSNGNIFIFQDISSPYGRHTVLLFADDDYIEALQA